MKAVELDSYKGSLWQTRSSGYSMRVKTLLEKYFNVVSIMRTDGDTLLAMLLEAYSSRKKSF